MTTHRLSLNGTDELLVSTGEALLLDGTTETVSGTWASIEFKDIMHLGSNPSGVWGSTEAKDTFHASGVVPVQLALDGHANGQFTVASSGTVTLTTTQADDVILVCLHSEKSGGSPTVTGVSGGGLTWAKHKQLIFGDDVNEIWWAHAPSPLSATVITVSMTGNTDDATIAAFGVSGANVASPFDVNVSIPATATGSVSTGTVTGVSTTAAKTMLIGFLGTVAGVAPSVGAGYTQIEKFTNFVGGRPSSQTTEYKLVTAAQSNVSVAMGSASGDVWGMIATAIQAAPPAAFASWGSTEAKDTFAAHGPPGGVWGSVELKDTFAFSGYPQMNGTWASTETPDHFAATGFPIPPLGIDAHVTGGDFDSVGAAITSAHVTLSSTFANDVIVACIYVGGAFSPGVVTSVTDSAGLVWQKRNARHSIGVANPSTEIWWAHAPSPLVGDIITVHTTNAGFICIDAVAIKGANFTHPWDTHTGAGWYNDNLGPSAGRDPNPVGAIYTDSTKSLVLAFYGSKAVATDGTVSAPFTYLSTNALTEHNGFTGHTSLAFALFATQQAGQAVSFGVAGGDFNSRAFMQDVIVAADQTASTDDLVRWYFDGAGNQTILSMSGTANSVTQTFTNYDPNSVVCVAVLMSANGQLGSPTVNSVTDTGNHSGWTRRSRITDDIGTLVMEVWYVQMADAFSGNITVTADNVAAGDILSYISFAINGPDVFLRGEIWDNDPSLPKTAFATSNSFQVAGPFNTLNENCLVIGIGANISTDLTLFNHLPHFLFLPAPAELVSSSPPFNIGLEFTFAAAPLTGATAEFDASPRPSRWLMVADALPVGPPTPPRGIWASIERADFTQHSGDFTAIGVSSPGGWFGFPANTLTMTIQEGHDRFTGSPFQAPYDGIGWLGWVPAFATMASIEARDTAHLAAWVLGQPLTGQMRLQEDPDRFAASNIAAVTAHMGATEKRDRWASTMLLIPKAVPIPARKRRLLIVT